MDDIDLSELFKIIHLYKINDLAWLSANISINNIWTIRQTPDGLRVMAGIYAKPRGYLVTFESWAAKHKHWEFPLKSLPSDATR